MQSPITLEALHILDAIDRRGSFAAAANELDRAPSSLSYQIQKLEQDLDIIIFDRSGHKAHFTEAGKLILERGRAILQASEKLVNDATLLLMVGNLILRWLLMELFLFQISSQW